MAWKGKIFGALFGFFVGRGLYGAIVGFLIGSLIDEALSGRGRVFPAGGPRPISIAEVFFRTTFELMGHVAKADGRVTEAEIDAARRLMQRLNLTPPEVARFCAAARTRVNIAYPVLSFFSWARTEGSLERSILSRRAPRASSMFSAKPCAAGSGDE